MNRWLLGVLVLVFSLCPCLPAEAILTEGRAYEMVSPPYKGGYGANAISAVAPNGESLIFESLGAFDGEPVGQATNTYLAHRETSGWSSSALTVPATLAPYSELVDFTPNLESVLFSVKPGGNLGLALHTGTETEFLSHETDTSDTPAGWELDGQALQALMPSNAKIAYEGASENFSHILFESQQPMLGGTENAEAQLYDLATSGEGESLLKLVGLNNHDPAGVIDLQCPVVPGERFGKPSSLNAISADGSEVFFTTNVKTRGSCEGNPQNPVQLFVRIGRKRTLEISRPLESSKPFGGCGDELHSGEVPGEVPCPGAGSRASAQFVGASEDGSKVYFMTTAGLVNGDTDSTSNLYMATIGCPGGQAECESEPGSEQVTSLLRVSQAQNGTALPAEVQGVIGMSPDGSRIYFIARGALADNLGVNTQGYGAHGEPVNSSAVAQAGADNMYVFDAETGQTSFIVSLCSGSGLSGQMTDYACPSSLNALENDDALWTSGAPEAQLADEGRFLVFSSYGRLTADDVDSARDVYRYDAETGALERVSIGEDGFDVNGNKSEFDASISSTQNDRAISEDGAHILFSTAEPLSEDAVNHFANLYEWRKEPSWSKGEISLISTGSADEPVERSAMAAEGRDIFLVTSQGLLPQDTDGADDVYDARIKGGFPLTPAPQQPCSGDACQGPLSLPAPAIIPGSVIQTPGGDFVQSVPKSKAKKLVVKLKHKDKVKKGKDKVKKKKDKGSTGASATGEGGR